jgi:ribonuclease P protein component
MHVVAGDAATPSRFGFVVSKAVGNAPQRNLIKRRLKMLARPLVTTLHGDIVFRALPSAAHISWDQLQSDVGVCVEKALKSHA